MWTVLITILVHKSLIAFSLGLSAFKVFHHFKNCLYAMIIFCISRFGSSKSSYPSDLVHHPGQVTYLISGPLGLSGTKKSPIGVLIGTLLKELLISKKRTDIVLGKNIIVYNKNDFKKII